MTDDADMMDPIRQAYGPDSRSTADVMSQYQAPIQRGSILPFSQQGDQAFLDVPFPAASHAAWEAIKRLMSEHYGYKPGSHEEGPIQDAANVVGAVTGFGRAPSAVAAGAKEAAQALERDRTLDALKLHLRTIDKEGAWPGIRGYGYFTGAPIAVEAAFAPWQGAAAPWMMGGTSAAAAAAAAAFLKPHYDMIMKKRDYLRAMDARLAAQRPKTPLDEYGFPEGALRAPKPWAPEFVGPPDPAFQWTPKYPHAAESPVSSPAPRSAMDEMIARAEATSREREQH